MKGHTAPVRSVSFSNDGKHLITASDDKTAKIWSLPSRKFDCSLVGHSNWVRSAKFSKDATYAVTGGDDKLVKLWDTATHRSLHTFHEHNDIVNSVEFHPDGKCVASGSADGTIKLWDTRSHLLLQHYKAHDAAVTSISLHPTGYYMISTSKDSNIKLWDLREGRTIFTMQGHSGSVNTATFSADGHFFASGGSDQLVMVWKSNLYNEHAKNIPQVDWSQSPQAVEHSFSKSTPAPSRLAPNASTIKNKGSVYNRKSQQQLSAVSLSEKNTMTVHAAKKALTATVSSPPREISKKIASSLSNVKAHTESNPLPLPPSPKTTTKNVTDNSGQDGKNQILVQTKQQAAEKTTSILHDSVDQSKLDGIVAAMNMMMSKMDQVYESINIMDQRLTLTERQVMAMTKEVESVKSNRLSVVSEASASSLEILRKDPIKSREDKSASQQEEATVPTVVPANIAYELQKMKAGLTEFKASMLGAAATMPTAKNQVVGGSLLEEDSRNTSREYRNPSSLYGDELDLDTFAVSTSFNEANSKFRDQYFPDDDDDDSDYVPEDNDDGDDEDDDEDDDENDLDSESEESIEESSEEDSEDD